MVKAIAEKMVTTDILQASFEKNIGKPVAKSPIDRLLKRHDWRQVVPGPNHPPKNPIRQEDVKNNFPNE
ncbi:MAG: hypothetical protein OXC92_01655 [Flavobacteriaceae bacterium]|nr:hypothetical protein [Flavobacteriaceae bacterium]